MCDGEDDCGGDNSGESEEICGIRNFFIFSFLNLYDMFLPNKGGTSRPCTESEFRCGGGKCIRNVNVCDGNNDCPDSSDEHHCDKISCPLGKVQYT